MFGLQSGMFSGFGDDVYFTHGSVPGGLYSIFAVTLFEIDHTFPSHKLIGLLVVVYLLQLISFFIEEPHGKNKEKPHQNTDYVTLHFRVSRQIHVPAESNTEMGKSFKRNYATNISIHVYVCIYVSEKMDNTN